MSINQQSANSETGENSSQFGTASSREGVSRHIQHSWVIENITVPDVSNLMVAAGLVEPDAHKGVIVRCVNSTDEPLTLNAGTCFAKFSPVDMESTSLSEVCAADLCVAENRQSNDSSESHPLTHT